MNYVLMLIWILAHAIVGTMHDVYLPLWLSISIFICGIVGYCMFKHRYIQRNYFSMLCMAIAIAGLAEWHASTALKDVLSKRVDYPKQVEVVVYIDQMNQLKSDSLSYQQKMQVYRPSQQDQVIWNSLIQIKKYSANYFQIGQYYKIKGHVIPIHGYAVPSAFDLERLAIQQRVMGQLSIEQVEPISQSSVIEQYSVFTQQHRGLFYRWKVWVEQQRLNYRNSLQAQTNIEHQGLMLALLTGDQSLLNASTKQMFKELGLSHLLAISGPHILIFAILLSWWIQKLIYIFKPTLYLICPRPYFLAIPMLFGAFLYGMFVGFEIPAIRTWLTLVILALSLFFKYPLKALNVVLLSASVVLVFDPLQVLSAAFWLSYSACFILIRIYQVSQNIFQNQEYRSNWVKLKQVIILFVMTQIQIFFALLPITLYYFHEFSGLTPLSNFIAIPYISLIVVPLTIIAAVLYVINSALGCFLWQCLDSLIRILLFLLDLVQSIPVSLMTPAFSIWKIIALALMVLIIFLPRGVISKFYALCLILILCLPNKNKSFVFYILDVGQGQAIFARADEFALMIDMAGKFNTFQNHENKNTLADTVIFPFLTQQGVKKLDLVVLSHHDIDHSGSFYSVTQKIPAQQVISNEYDNTLISEQQRFSFCQTGQTLVYGDMQIDFLYPTEMNMIAHPSMSKNESSCVVYLTYQQKIHILIMGDTGKLAEQTLMQKYPKLPIDVLVLAHHGSKSSSSREFLAHYQPRIAVASAGYRNRYGHPHQDVKERLAQLNIPLWITSEQGSIQFTIEQDSAMLQTTFYRDQWQWLR